MPMYEYKCGQCGERFEVIQRFSDEPLKTHQGCGGSVERLLSAPALQFKGSGFYITDYAKSGNSPSPPKNGGDSAAAKSGESKTASTSSESSSSSSTSSTSTASTDNKK